MPVHYYWLLFGIDNFKQEVHTAKGAMNKGKLDRQLTVQGKILSYPP